MGEHARLFRGGKMFGLPGTVKSHFVPVRPIIWYDELQKAFNNSTWSGELEEIRRMSRIFNTVNKWCSPKAKWFFIANESGEPFILQSHLDETRKYQRIIGPFFSIEEAAKVKKLWG